MGYFYALLGAVLFAANGSVTKVVLASGLEPTELTFLRALATALLSGAILLVVRRDAFRISRQQLGVMAVLGLAGVAMIQWLYAVAVMLLPVGIALLLEYLAVLLVALISFLFFTEKVKARLWVAIGCVLIGLALVAQLGQNSLDIVGVIAGILAACGLTVYFLVGERQVTATSPMAVAFWSMSFAAVFWGIFSGWWTIDPASFVEQVSLGGNLENIVVPMWVPLIWNLIFGSFLAFLLSFAALKHLTATAAGIVASSEVIFAFIVAWLWLGETLEPIQIIGASIVVAGIVLAQTARANKSIDLDLASAGIASPDRLA